MWIQHNIEHLNYIINVSGNLSTETHSKRYMIYVVAKQLWMNDALCLCNYVTVNPGQTVTSLVARSLFKQNWTHVSRMTSLGKCTRQPSLGSMANLQIEKSNSSFLNTFLFKIHDESYFFCTFRNMFTSLFEWLKTAWYYINYSNGWFKQFYNKQ